MNMIKGTEMNLAEMNVTEMNGNEITGMNRKQNDSGYVRKMGGRIYRAMMNEEEGLDGILVTVGLCIIALLLCVVMRDSLTSFIQTLVTEMTNTAKNILSTAGVLVMPGGWM